MPSTVGTLTEFTFNSLDGASDGTRQQSLFADLGANGADGLHIEWQVTPVSSAGSTDAFIDLFLARGINSSVLLEGGATGVDSTFVPDNAVFQVRNLHPIDRIVMNTGTGSTVATYRGFTSIVSPVPRFVSAVIESQLGVNVSSTAADNFVKFQAFNYSS